MVWTDNMVVPNKATHKANVETMMNFYYDPVNAAKLAAWNYYLCPVAGAQDEIAQFDKSAVDSPFIFLDEATMANGHQFKSMSSTRAQKLQTPVQRGDEWLRPAGTSGSRGSPRSSATSSPSTTST